MEGAVRSNPPRATSRNTIRTEPLELRGAPRIVLSTRTRALCRDAVKSPRSHRSRTSTSSLADSAYDPEVGLNNLEVQMIIRIFRARPKPGMADELAQLIEEVSIPFVDRQPGFLAPCTGRGIRSPAIGACA